MDKVAEYQDLLTRAVARVRLLGVDLEIVAREKRIDHRIVDAVVRFRANGQPTEHLVEVKKGLRPATLGATLLQMRELEQLGKPVLLVTDYVTPQLAEKLRGADVPFVDVAGNAYLNQPPLFIWVKGEKPPERCVTERAVGRAFQATGLKVVFAMLCHPGWVDKPYREIAELAGVAHGTVGWVMTDLEQNGYIVKLKRVGRRLRNRRQLLNTWVEAYARVLRPKLLMGRYETAERGWWEKANVLNYGLQWGGEPAAAVLDHYLRPGITTLYGENLPNRFIAENRLRTDEKGYVEMRKRFWHFEYEWAWPELVPPVLIYADLLAEGNARCIEAAQRIYEKHLARFFEQN
jgi:hypothetical protein